MTANSQAVKIERFDQLLRWHRRHLGLFARVAGRARVAPSYVSLVARGFRRNERVTAALTQELEHLLRTAPR